MSTSRDSEGRSRLVHPSSSHQLMCRVRGRTRDVCGHTSYKYHGMFARGLQLVRTAEGTGFKSFGSGAMSDVREAAEVFGNSPKRALTRAKCKAL